MTQGDEKKRGVPRYSGTYDHRRHGFQASGTHINLASARPARKVSLMHLLRFLSRTRSSSRRRSAHTTVLYAFLVTSGAVACHRAAAPRGNSATVPSVAAGAGVVERDPLQALPAALYGAQLPDRLDDSTFWRMVREFSEPNGYFQSENFVSNEMGLQYVIERLESLSAPGGVYVGVGPEQNFTYFGALKPRVAFIVDIRRQNLLQHLWYKAIFEMSPTRAEFLSRLFARPSLATAPKNVSADSLIALLTQAPSDQAMFRTVFDEARKRLVQEHGFTLDSVDLETLRYVDSIFVSQGADLNYSSGSSGRGGFRGGRNSMPSFGQIAITTNPAGVNRGFLGSEASYSYVRDLQRRNLVVPVVGDFAGPKALRAVGTWIRNHGARVNTFYTSNVEQYLFQSPDNWSRFYQNVGTMPLDSTSAFIRSVTNRGMNFNSNFLMTQLTSSILEVVRGSEAGTVRQYYDVIGISRP